MFRILSHCLKRGNIKEVGEIFLVRRFEDIDDAILNISDPTALRCTISTWRLRHILTSPSRWTKFLTSKLSTSKLVLATPAVYIILVVNVPFFRLTSLLRALIIRSVSFIIPALLIIKIMSFQKHKLLSNAYFQLPCQVYLGQAVKSLLTNDRPAFPLPCDVSKQCYISLVAPICFLICSIQFPPFPFSTRADSTTFHLALSFSQKRRCRSKLYTSCTADSTWNC